MSNLAALYVTLERYTDAEPLYLQAMAISFQRLGETHPNTQTVWGNFIQFLQQAVQNNCTSKLSEHPVTRSILQQLQSASE